MTRPSQLVVHDCVPSGMLVRIAVTVPGMGVLALAACPAMLMVQVVRRLRNHEHGNLTYIIHVLDRWQLFHSKTRRMQDAARQLVATYIPTRNLCKRCRLPRVLYSQHTATQRPHSCMFHTLITSHRADCYLCKSTGFGRAAWSCIQQNRRQSNNHFPNQRPSSFASCF